MTTKSSQADRDTCYFCGEQEDIEQHHILPQRFDGSDRESNMVSLCHDCHWKLERLYNKDFWAAIGIKDPRSTKETHLTCVFHGCLNQAIDSFTTTSGNTTYRCEKHKPSNTQEEPRLTSIEGVDEEFIEKTISQLKLASLQLGDDGTYPSELDSVISDGKDWEIPDQDGLATMALIRVDLHEFKIELKNDEWVVSHEGYRDVNSL